MSILIGADLVPTSSNKKLFSSGDVETLVGTDLLTIIKDADYRIFNLETPIADFKSPIDKCGPNHVAPVSTIKGISRLGVDLFTLSNNHIMDQGVKGLVSTIKELKDHNINYVGVGNTVEEASEPYFFEIKGRKYGVYACAEHEFSIVSDDRAGANPIDLLDTPEHIEKAKAKCDYLIVLYHGGKEYYRYPSPNLQKLFRKLADKGADLIIAQHTHCVGCYENYNGSTLVYGQGNFLFDDEDNEYYATSILIKLNDDLSIDYIPLEKKDNLVRLSNSNSIVNSFFERSEEIKKEGFIQNIYKLNSERFFYSYCSRISGMESFFFKVLNKLLNNKIRKRVYKRKYLKNKRKNLAVVNVLDCEAHREMFTEGLENL